MHTIYKYPLRALGENSIEMPDSAKLLTVQMQDGVPCLWALVDTKNPMVIRKILMFGTGHDVCSAGRYISTFQMQGGALVFHVFES